MQMSARKADDFFGLKSAALRLGHWIDRAIRRLEDRHRGDLPYMRPDSGTPNFAARQQQAETDALPAALAGLADCLKAADAATLKSRADEMAGLAQDWRALHDSAAHLKGARREPIWAGGFARRFRAFAAPSHDVAARDQHKTENEQRGQA